MSQSGFMERLWENMVVHPEKGQAIIDDYCGPNLHEITVNMSPNEAFAKVSANAATQACYDNVTHFEYFQSPLGDVINGLSAILANESTRSYDIIPVISTPSSYIVETTNSFLPRITTFDNSVDSCFYSDRQFDWRSQMDSEWRPVSIVSPVQLKINLAKKVEKLKNKEVKLTKKINKKQKNCKPSIKYINERRSIIKKINKYQPPQQSVDIIIPSEQPLSVDIIQHEGNIIIHPEQVSLLSELGMATVSGALTCLILKDSDTPVLEAIQTGAIIESLTQIVKCIGSDNIAQNVHTIPLVMCAISLKTTYESCETSSEQMVKACLFRPLNCCFSVSVSQMGASAGFAIGGPVGAVVGGLIGSAWGDNFWTFLYGKH